MTEHTDSRLASLGAKAIYRGFDDYQRSFKTITREAKALFEQRNWTGIQANAAARLDVYAGEIKQLVADVRELLGERIDSAVVWAGMKAVYSSLIDDRDDWEIAETFFNSVTRRIFVTVGVNQQIEFISTDFETPQTQAQQAVFRTYHPHDSTELIRTILNDYAFAVPYADLERDVQLVASVIDQRLAEFDINVANCPVDVICPVFYRNKGAYIIGRIIVNDKIMPLAIALLNPEQGIQVDAILLQERELSMLFSFTRSYFHVDVDRPYDLVQFLASLMPNKRIAELYIAIGYHKHGKTELYRNFLRHLATSTDQFEIARGERGMVMTVFTLPSFDMVFKIIKDRFAPPKNTTRKEVIGKYHLVFKHDRAGRLIDAQEFEFLEIDRCRFSEALLDELLNVAPSSVSVNADRVVIKHSYIERRLTPLDVFLRETSDEAAAQAATLEFGKAIKDLAASNIFPGDMLLKNFGVTRNGRVVFYDYDELCLLSECFFKYLPVSDDYDDEMAAEPSFAVGEFDVFPEQFGHFLGLRAPLRQLFMQVHGDILTVPFWQNLQKQIKAGEIVDIFPYSQSRRLHQ